MDAELPPVRLAKLDRIAPNNIHGPHAAFRYEVQGGGAEGPGAVDPSVLERLAAFVPGILDIGACGRSGALTWPHLVEHLFLELQKSAGANLACTRAGGRAADLELAIVPFEQENIHERAMRWVEGVLGASPDFDAREGLERFTEYVGRKMLPAQDRMLIASARDRDVPVSGVAGRTFTLGQGCHQRRISATKTSLTNIVSNDLAANKDYARRILGELGLPVPAYARVYSRRAALEAAERIGFPVVMKPIFGSMGRGVIVGVSNAKELRAAYRRVREFGKAVLVEELVPGDDYRLLVIDGKLCAAARRMPGHVVGDGQRTVRELVDEANADPRRGHDHNAPLTRLELDEQAHQLLARRGYDVDAVPAPDEVVFLRRNANLSTGGTAIDVTDEVHPETRQVAERTARAIGLDIAGVDLLTTDISRSLFDTGGKICEVNSRPGIRKHIWPVEGQSRDVTGPIVDMLFPDGSDGRIPVVAVIGSDAADLTARMLAHVLRAAGRRVGLGHAGRVEIDGVEQRREQRLAPPGLVRGVLHDPDVEVAVLQFDADAAVRHGLDCDAFDVTLLVDEEGADPAGVDLVLATTRGSVVVDAADSRSLEGGTGEPELDPIRIARRRKKGVDPRSHRAATFAAHVARQMDVPLRVCREALASFVTTDEAAQPGAEDRRTGAHPRRKR
jgi:cyanophycin synthetase